PSQPQPREPRPGGSHIAGVGHSGLGGACLMDSRVGSSGTNAAPAAQTDLGSRGPRSLTGVKSLVPQGEQFGVRRPVAAFVLATEHWDLHAPLSVTTAASKSKAA